MISNKELKNFCDVRRNSYLAIFHPPNEVPTMFHTKNFVELQYTKELLISTDLTTSDESLKSFEPEERNCYYENERELRFFKSYSQVHCEYECMINFTMEMCKCVKFSMPRSNDMKTCLNDDVPCYNNLMIDWPKNYFNFHRSQDISKFPCNCMETCTKLSYKIINERNFHINEQSSKDTYTILKESYLEKG